MASEIQGLIQKLREAECRRHRESLLAIETLEQNMLGSGAPAEKELADGDQRQRIGNNGQGPFPQTRNVDRVLSVLDTQKFRSLEEIVGSTGLDEAKVRAALYGRAMKSRIEKKKVKKRFAFRLATQPPLPESNVQKNKSASVTSQVRALLRDHPAGLQTSEIHQALSSIKRVRINTALHSLKKAQQVIHDESTHIYRPA